MQTVVALINRAIGASGVVSQECKAVVNQYGQTILDLLFAEVKYKTYVILVYIFFPCSRDWKTIMICLVCILSITGPTKEGLFANWIVHL